MFLQWQLIYRKSSAYFVNSRIPISSLHVHLGGCESHLCLKTGHDPTKLTDKDPDSCGMTGRTASVVFFPSNWEEHFIVLWLSSAGHLWHKCLALKWMPPLPVTDPFVPPTCPRTTEPVFFLQTAVSAFPQTCIHDLKSEPLLTPVTPNLLSRQWTTLNLVRLDPGMKLSISTQLKCC